MGWLSSWLDHCKGVVINIIHILKNFFNLTAFIVAQLQNYKVLIRVFSSHSFILAFLKGM